MKRFASLALSLALVGAGAAAGCSAGAPSHEDDHAPGGSGVTRPDAGAPPSPTSDDGAGAGTPVDAAAADGGADCATDAPDAPDAGDPADADDGAPLDLGLDCGGADGGDAGGSNVDAAPELLGCTGLYARWPTRTIAKTAMPYDPGVHLWSDGADKARFIQLPPGTQIDTHDMNEWTFPVGTKLWKEFSFAGKKVETRYLWKRGPGDWVRATYRWSDDQQTATRFSSGAFLSSGYEIPSVDQCETCHEGRVDFVLGFEAIGLSLPTATGLTMSELVKRGWVTNAPTAPIAIPGDATAQAALGWLHANCGTACHNPSPQALAGSTGLFMRLEVGALDSVQSTSTWKTAVNVPASFRPPDGTALLRIKPRDVAHSCVPYRDGTRDKNGEGIQMPPIDTHVVDTAGVQLVKDWINAM